MFLPLRDHNPTLRVPVVTLGLIVLNALVWLLELAQGSDLGLFLTRWGATPYELTHFTDLVGRIGDTTLVHAPAPAFLPVTAITSMFLHGGWAHLIFNMLFLWVFGNNVEDFLGRARFLLFYLFTGLAGLAAHVLTEPNSVLPVVGASGAISGMLGAYMVLYPRARVITLVFFWLVEIPAIVVILMWAVMQVVGGLVGLGMGAGGGVAYFAHIGGFAAGWLGIRRVAGARLAEHRARAAFRQFSEPHLRERDFRRPWRR